MKYFDFTRNDQRHTVYVDGVARMGNRRGD